MIAAVRSGLLPSLGACLLVTLTVSGCRDADSSPLAAVLTQETRGALSTGSELPSLTDLAARTGLEGRFQEEVARWSDSWARDPRAGRSARSAVYGAVVAPLSRELGREGVEAVVVSVEEAVEATTALDPTVLGARLTERLERAGKHRDLAATALAGGHLDEALEGALRAADLLREVGPESVSRLLVARADGALQLLRTRGVDEADHDFRRARRLLRGARQATDEGAFVLAVRRAYYACQLLGVDPR